MSLVTWNGHLLLTNGKLTTGPAAAECCCEDVFPTCCLDLPATLYLDVECPDTSEVVTWTLNEVDDGCTEPIGPCVPRRWEGTNQLSCEAGPSTVYVICDGTYVSIHWDAFLSGPPADICNPDDYTLGGPFDYGDTQPPPWSDTIAPPAGCEECGTFVNWTLRTS